MRNLRGPIIALIVAPLLTVVTYSMALKSAAGETLEVSGRRRALKQLLVSAAETLGPTGCLAVGAIATVLAAVWLVRIVQVRQKITTTGNAPESNLTV